MIDFLGRAWTRTNPQALVCEDGTVCYTPTDAPEAECLALIRQQYISRFKPALENAVERHLSAVAQSLGYVDMQRAATYVTSKVRGAEAQALVDWRDAVWGHCATVLNEVASGVRKQVPSEQSLINELPKFSHA